MKQRYGQVIGLRPEKVEEYKKLHAAVWPAVLDRIKKSHIRNYSIYLRKIDGENHCLFSYFEYIGSNFSEDMAAIAADPQTQKWWALCMPCQMPLKDLDQAQWWADMEEVFHCD